MKVKEEFSGSREQLLQRLFTMVSSKKLTVAGKEIPWPEAARVRVEYDDGSGTKAVTVSIEWI
ncbi:MAG: hypothetical protein M0Z31_00045 [Clostridia bacterium]|nr:hypothetical protein [Clostridia bacterium]